MNLFRRFAKPAKRPIMKSAEEVTPPISAIPAAGTDEIRYDDTNQRSCKILVYGIEKAIPMQTHEPISDRNFEISFEPFDTNRRFDGYDGVILFQGIFETITTNTNWASRRYVSCTCYKDEMDKRINETKLLLGNAGFICVILCKPFVDNDFRSGISFVNKDMAKVLLNYSSLYRKNLETRTTPIQCIRPEFTRFLERYGAAHTVFDNYNDNIVLRPIAKTTSGIAGMILYDQYYFVPALLPENNEECINEYFTLLADAVVSTRNKLLVDVPEWINQFAFEEEIELEKERTVLAGRIGEIDASMDILKKYKRALIESGDSLVKTVGNIFEHGFRFRVDTTDDFREDLKIIDANGTPLAICEVKGVNTGVRREYINQAESHRDRAKLPVTFPTLLIINTHIKNARKLEEKDEDVPKEQIQHATRNNILIIRTLDLLNLLKLALCGKVKNTDILSLITENAGWLKVSASDIEVIKD